MARFVPGVGVGLQLGDTTTLADASVVETVHTATGKRDEDQA